MAFTLFPKTIASEAEQKELELLYTVFAKNTPSEAHQLLLADQTASGKFYKQRLSQLAEIANEPNQFDLNLRLSNFLKDIFYSALQDHGIHLSLHIELCIAGSLARGQATPYSDIDCFLIFGDSVPEETKKQIQDITKQIFSLADGLFYQTKQFSMDPFGISLSKLNGTVEELVEYIQEIEPENELGPMTCSILNAKSISGDNILLNALQSKLTESGKKIVYEDYFKKVFTDFNGPKSDNESINLKSDLIRPVDFILQGLRCKENLPAEKYDTSAKLLDELERRGTISFSIKKLIERLQSESYRLRRALHQRFGKEHDEITVNEKTKELLGWVGWLRGSLHHYTSNQAESFDLVDGAYASNHSEFDINQADLQSKTRLSLSMPKTHNSQEEKGEIKGVKHGIKEKEEFTNRVLAAVCNKQINSRLTRFLRDGFKEHGSFNFGMISRILNEVKSPHSEDETQKIADSLESKIYHPLIREKQNIDFNELEPEDLEKITLEIANFYRSWFKKMLLAHVFPHLFNEQGKFHSDLWKLLFFPYLGEQTQASQTSLNELTQFFVGGYVVNIIMADSKIQAVLNEHQLILPLSKAFQVLSQDASLFAETMQEYTRVESAIRIEAEDRFFQTANPTQSEDEGRGSFKDLIPLSKGPH